MKPCWICGDPADTGEHSIKKNVLIDVFDRYEPTKGKRLHKWQGEEKRVIQGFNSDSLKYSNSLCAKCNNQLTQPFDRSFERFIDYIRNNFKSVVRKKRINLKLVYNKNVKVEVGNLYRYFTKIFGCALYDANQKVPKTLIDAAKGLNYKNEMGVAISFDGELLALGVELSEICEVFPVEGDQDLNNRPMNYQWGIAIGSMAITFWYNMEAPPQAGAKWYGKKKEISLSTTGI